MDLFISYSTHCHVTLTTFTTRNAIRRIYITPFHFYSMDFQWTLSATLPCSIPIVCRSSTDMSIINACWRAADVLIMTRSWQQSDSSFTVVERSKKVAGNLKMIGRLGSMAYGTLHFNSARPTRNARPPALLLCFKFEFKHTLVSCIPPSLADSIVHVAVPLSLIPLPKEEAVMVCQCEAARAAGTSQPVNQPRPRS
jgi:hypothetical protein